MFFGWRVVAGSFISMMVMLGFFSYTFTLFVTPLREEFNVGLQEVMYALTLGMMLNLVASPVIGILVDRMSLRLLMTGGALVVAAGFFGMARAESIAMFNILFAVSMSLASSVAGPMACTAVVSRWFTRHRGRALGITTAGSSVGGMAMPALAAWWLADVGWRTTLEYFALMALGVAALLWLNIRGRPAELGLETDGDLPAGAELDGAAAETLGVERAAPGAVGAAVATRTAPLDEAAPPPGIMQIVMQREFWLIGLSMGLLLATFSAMLSNISPYATGLGASKAEASRLIMLLAVTGLVGKLAFGVAADRINLKLGMWVTQALVLITFLLLALQPAYAVIALAAFTLGLATGGLLPVWNSMMAQVFGVDSYGRAMGAMGPIITLLVMPAYVLVGRLYDMHGNYVTVLLLFAVLIVLAALLMVPVRLPDHRQA